MTTAELKEMTLTKGAHTRRGDGMCATEAVAWLAGEDHTDQPTCLSLALGQFLRRWNDDLDDEGRQRLKPYLPRCIGTAGDGQDEARGWLAADWLVRVHTPAWLELGGVEDAAAALRALPELRDLEVLEQVQPEVESARAKAAAAWDAAGAAAWNAAWAAAWNAAWALVVRDLISTEHYDTPTLPWRTTIGPIHDDDAAVPA